MKCAKMLFIGDLHFKVKNVEYVHLFTSKITAIADSTADLDFVLIAGDLLDNHDKIDVEPLNLALQLIHFLSQKHKTFVLVGNHDYKNNQQFLSNKHWMNALKRWSNVSIVDSVVEHEASGVRFLFVPYVPPGRFKEALETRISLEEILRFKAVFAHQEFYGCKMGPIQSKHGDKWDDKWPLVISGHIHDKQWSQQNIYYPGSAMQHAFGQSSENTVSVITWTDDEMQYEEIDLGMPKLTIKYINIDDIMKPLKFKNKQFRKYKIVLRGTQEEFKVFKKNSRYKQLLDEGFKITFKTNVVVPFGRPGGLIEPKKKFIEVLQEKIKNEKDPQLEQIYHSFV